MKKPIRSVRSKGRKKIKPIHHWHCFVVGSIHKAVTIPLADYRALLKKVREYRKALKRLALCEAFDLPKWATTEERMRMKYAQDCLDKIDNL